MEEDDRTTWATEVGRAGGAPATQANLAAAWGVGRGAWGVGRGRGAWGAIDPRRVVAVSSNDHVQILRRPGVSMEGDRMPAKDPELRLGVGQGDEEVAKVIGELDHVLGLGTNLQGIWSRV
jgi:hypothetical protein